MSVDLRLHVLVKNDDQSGQTALQYAQCILTHDKPLSIHRFALDPASSYLLSLT
ncbi:hypothetical protein K4A83_20185 [Spirulina subsalsa FACHB-351]|uniref:Uncharacterized protein n=1 Tax=Spirulina subsalsa FACHB-351 TaxID=234711 RepID=A0ABT3LBV9_9CYAN|nr:hypothetical protein [Spirulina subsalsa]MCW6038574.1 hypothetical protein [Spirulina subsalsa FACHB-351]